MSTWLTALIAGYLLVTATTAIWLFVEDSDTRRPHWPSSVALAVLWPILLPCRLHFAVVRHDRRRRNRAAATETALEGQQ